MKTLVYTLIFTAALVAFSAIWIKNLPSSQKLEPIEEPIKIDREISVELSVGGEIRVFKAPAESSIHIITDDNRVLTDIQVLRHGPPCALHTISTTTTPPQKYGKPANTSTAASSP